MVLENLNLKIGLMKQESYWYQIEYQLPLLIFIISLDLWLYVVEFILFIWQMNFSLWLTSPIIVIIHSIISFLRKIYRLQHSSNFLQALLYRRDFKEKEKDLGGIKHWKERKVWISGDKKKSIVLIQSSIALKNGFAL